MTEKAPGEFEEESPLDWTLPRPAPLPRDMIPTVIPQEVPEAPKKHPDFATHELIRTILEENKLLRENITNTINRCSELLNENRALKKRPCSCT